jgi:putative membrane protein
MNTDRFIKQFNWRFLLVRIVVNAFALAGTAAFTPKIYFVDTSFSNWVLMALMLGVLNALLKPVLQFLTLQFIFVTYGLVIVLVNALLLWLLAFLFPNRFAAESIWWLLLGGLILGLLSSFLESLLGLTMPIVPEEPTELRSQIDEQARQVEWLTTATSEPVSKQGAPAMESPVPEPDSTEPVKESPTPEQDVSPSPDKLSSTEVVKTERIDPDVHSNADQAAISESSEPVSEPREGQEEDQS